MGEAQAVMGKDETRTLAVVEAMRRRLPLDGATLNRTFGSGFAEVYEAWRVSPDDSAQG